MKGEMHLELGIDGWDYATRKCAAVVLPLGTPVWVTKDCNAKVTAYGMRIAPPRHADILEIYVDSEGADQGFPTDATDAEKFQYLSALRARGWQLHKYPK